MQRTAKTSECLTKRVSDSSGLRVPLSTRPGLLIGAPVFFCGGIFRCRGVTTIAWGCHTQGVMPNSRGIGLGEVGLFKTEDSAPRALLSEYTSAIWDQTWRKEDPDV